MVLLNISFPTEVLSVPKCISRGFQVVEDTSLNRSSKYFHIQIPFKDPVVQQMVLFFFFSNFASVTFYESRSSF